MFKGLKHRMTRAQLSMLEDGLGVISLFVLLFAGLSFTGAA